MVAVTWEQVSPLVYLVIGAALSMATSVWVDKRRFELEDDRNKRARQRDLLVELVGLVDEADEFLANRDRSYRSEPAVRRALALSYRLADDALRHTLRAILKKAVRPVTLSGMTSLAEADRPKQMRKATGLLTDARSAIEEALRTTYA